MIANDKTRVMTLSLRRPGVSGVSHTPAFGLVSSQWLSDGRKDRKMALNLTFRRIMPFQGVGCHSLYPHWWYTVNNLETRRGDSAFVNFRDFDMI
jgi:hypothetical protein